MFLQLAEMKV
jgi:threonine dehydratase